MDNEKASGGWEQTGRAFSIGALVAVTSAVVGHGKVPVGNGMAQSLTVVPLLQEPTQVLALQYSRARVAD